MSIPSVKIRISDGAIIKHALYPRHDMQPVVGLDPIYKWLVKYEPFIVPDYDSRYYNLVVISTATTEPHPVYTWLDVYKRTYELVKRTNDDIGLSVKNAESVSNDKMLPQPDLVKSVILAIGTLIREADGITPSPAEVVIRTKFLNLAVKVWQNDQLLQDKVADIIAGNEPDINEGWQ